MNLLSLTVWFLIVGILSGIVVFKYNNRLAEAHLADQLACVLNTNSSCWEESADTPVRAVWERNIVNWQRVGVSAADGRIIQARYTAVVDEKRKRILKRLGGTEDAGEFIFERFAHPRHINIQKRGFRYMLNGKYHCAEPDELDYHCENAP